VDMSVQFQRFAAECEFMAKFTSNPENQLVWRRMAERWVQCAEVYERQQSLAHAAGPKKHHRKAAHNWAH
jgi:hypothetical protein